MQHHHTIAILIISIRVNAKHKDAMSSIQPINLVKGGEGNTRNTFVNTLLLPACFACLFIANIKHKKPNSCSIKTSVIIPAPFSHKC